MTGATGDLTPDEIQRDFKPGEWRETSDATHHADVTRAHAPSGPAQRGEPGGELEVGGPTNVATGTTHADTRDPRIGGDERTDHEDHL